LPLLEDDDDYSDDEDDEQDDGDDDSVGPEDTDEDDGDGPDDVDEDKTEADDEPKDAVEDDSDGPDDADGAESDDDPEPPSTAGKPSKRPADEFVGSLYQSAPDDGQASYRVLRWVGLITRTKAELLVLSQLVYWLGEGKSGKLRATIQSDGYWWVRKTYAKLAREVDLTPAQVRCAIRTLTDAGVVITRDDVEAGHLVDYRLSPNRIQELVEQCNAAPLKAPTKKDLSKKEDDHDDE
jgi:hypothetical protein